MLKKEYRATPLADPPPVEYPATQQNLLIGNDTNEADDVPKQGSDF